MRQLFFGVNAFDSYLIPGAELSDVHLLLESDTAIQSLRVVCAPD
jgi:hypothetical protein